MRVAEVMDVPDKHEVLMEIHSANMVDLIAMLGCREGACFERKRREDFEQEPPIPVSKRLTFFSYNVTNA